MSDETPFAAAYRDGEAAGRQAAADQLREWGQRSWLDGPVYESAAEFAAFFADMITSTGGEPVCKLCDHPESAHSGGECWTHPDNTDHPDPPCPCWWYEPQEHTDPRVDPTR